MREQNKRNMELKSNSTIIHTSVSDRLKAKLHARALDSQVTPSKAKSGTSPGRKATPIVIDTSSESDSNSSASHEDNATRTGGGTEASPKKSQKLAPGPETYSVSEIKRFASMAKTIKNVDEARGHSAAVADFVDLEFSDNSGMMIKARRAPKDSWKRNRFNSACAKAARIMEERSVDTPLVHPSTNSLCPAICV